jgi:hypothetical protein
MLLLLNAAHSPAVFPGQPVSSRPQNSPLAFCCSRGWYPALRGEKNTDDIFLERPTPGVDFGKLHRVDGFRCAHNRNEFRISWWRRRGRSLPPLLPPHALFPIKISVPAPGMVQIFFRREHRNVATQIADQGDAKLKKRPFLFG